MFATGAVVWLVVVAAGFAISVLARSGRVLTDRAAAPLYWVALVSALVMAVAPLVPPGVEEDPGPTDFSVRRAMAHVEAVAQQPHPIGSAANEDVRNYIGGQLRDLGLRPVFQQVAAADYYGGSDATVPVVNVMARIPGTSSTGSVALVAHFDTVPTTPGANDNASGVAVALETARSLLAGAAPQNDVVLLFTDGEEPSPRYGATAFVADHPWSDEVRFVVNLEAIGSSGPSMLIQMAGPQRWILDRYVDAAPQPVASSFLTGTMELIGGSNTDFAPFRDAGVPGVEFAYGQGSSIYHTPADTPDSVGQRSLQSHGANVVGLVQHLAGEELAATDGEDMVFFTVGLHQLIRYPTSWALPVVALAGLALVVAVQRRGGWSMAARGAVTTLARAVLAAALVTGLWMVLAGRRSTMGVFESYAHLLVLAALTVALIVIPLTLRPRIGPPIAPRVAQRFPPAGVLSIWWALALVTAVIAPEMSYVFVWPSLVGALALPAVSSGPGRGGRWSQLGPAAATIGVAAVVLIPVIDTFFLFAQPRPGNPDSEVLAVVVIPLLLVALGAQLALSFRVPSEVATANETGSTVLRTFSSARSPANDPS